MHLIFIPAGAEGICMLILPEGRHKNANGCAKQSDPLTTMCSVVPVTTPNSDVTGSRSTPVLVCAFVVLEEVTQHNRKFSITKESAFREAPMVLNGTNLLFPKWPRPRLKML